VSTIIVIIYKLVFLSIYTFMEYSHYLKIYVTIVSTYDKGKAMPVKKAKAKIKSKAKVKPKAKPKAKIKAKAKPKTKAKKKAELTEFACSSKAVAEARKKVETRGAPIRYHPEICEFLPFLFVDGETVGEVCSELGIVRDTYYRWKKLYPEFKDATEFGIQHAESWWTKVGREAANGKKKYASPAHWIFTMKNRFNWQDKVEVTDKNEREDIESQLDPDLSPKEAEKAYFDILKNL